MMMMHAVIDDNNVVDEDYNVQGRARALRIIKVTVAG